MRQSTCRRFAACGSSGDCRVADIGDVPFRSRYSLEQSLQDIEAYYRKLVALGVRPLRKRRAKWSAMRRCICPLMFEELALMTQRR